MAGISSSVEVQARELFAQKWRNRRFMVMTDDPRALGTMLANAVPGTDQAGESISAMDGAAAGAMIGSTVGAFIVPLVGSVALGMVGGLVGGVMAGIGNRRNQNRQDASAGQTQGVPIIPCSPDLLDTAVQMGLLLEPGEGFLFNTVYAGHPYHPATYTAIARFHRYLFESKVNELYRILECLGATWFSVRHMQLSQHSRAAELGMDVSFLGDDIIKGGVGGGTRKGSQSEIVYEARFNPTHAPHVPDDTVWLAKEPTWQNIVRSRLERGLTSIRVDLRYQNDFQVNGEVALSIENAGFSLGGRFTEYADIVWQVEGEFAAMDQL